MESIDTYRADGEGDYKTQFYDAIFKNRMNALLLKVESAYE